MRSQVDLLKLQIPLPQRPWVCSAAEGPEARLGVLLLRDEMQLPGHQQELSDKKLILYIVPVLILRAGLMMNGSE